MLSFVAVGHPNLEVARRLQISVRSVERHRENGLRKLGISTMADIVRWALHNGHVLAEDEEWDSERFLVTVRQAPLMVLVVDREMRFLDASEVALNELGYSYEELRRLSAHDIVVDGEDLERRIDAYLMTGVERGTIRLRRKDQSEFRASYSSTIRHSGEEQHYVSIAIPE